jgi:RNA polymerase sigma factor (sigma-70 family)
MMFIAYYSLEPPPHDARTWLIASACENARVYVERHRLACRDGLETLPALAREALRLRFAEGKSYPEIAEELGVSVDAAQRIVSKAAAKLARMRR